MQLKNWPKKRRWVYFNSGFNSSDAKLNLLHHQGDSNLAVKLEFEDNGVGGEGTTGENSVSKPKAPRVKKEKKEPG